MMMSRRASKCLMIENVVLLANQDSSSLTKSEMSYDIRMMYRNQVKLVELLVQVPHIYAMCRVVASGMIVYQIW